MDRPLFLEDYVKYLKENPNAKAHKQFKCSAWTGRDPLFIEMTTPTGTFLVYPEFAAFLTTSNAKPGFGRLVEYVWEQKKYLKPLMVFAGAANDPEGALAEIALTIYHHVSKKHVTKKEKEFLRKALTSPNSFFIPFNRIKDVKSGRNYIHINTDETRFVLYNSGIVSRINTALITGWQEDVVAILADAARKNQTERV